MKDALELLKRPTLTLRKPGPEDGADIWELVRNCPPLDTNSMYCNLVQCDHFRETCVLAELDGKVAGWISGHILPDDGETLFVWQVAVSETARGMGLGSRMLDHLVNRPACRAVRRLQTTITADNDASWALFRRFARSQGTKAEAQPYYTQTTHFRDRHQTENLVTIRLQARAKRAA